MSNKEQDIGDSRRQILHSLHEIEYTNADTLETLHRQGEQIKHSEETVRQTSMKVKYSRQLVRKLSSLGTVIGALVGLVEQSEPTNQINNDTQTNLNIEEVSSQMMNDQQQSDEFLDQVMSGLKRINKMAIQQQNILADQTNHATRMASQIDEVSEQVKLSTCDINRHLGVR